ncbi:DUF551 domain-containing protein [Escherichia coli]|nr:DUF551 domain-containing protein [Escherichia coli]EIG83846.1 PF04448 family protein [Escherichia coli 1.2741]ELJ0495300.1 DUF551 domain-containing protein [Escherichia coli O2]ELM5756101.1 DUF551 domain-containing protein [Escherichia coli]HAP3112161.1 DUF551 domain-containing protein [Escherichia coli]
MTTFTDKELIKEIKERISSLDVRDNIERRAYEIALASLEAEPIGTFHIVEQQVDGTSYYIKDGEWPIDTGIIEVYAASPMTVVLNDVSGPLALAYKELTPAIMRNHIAVFERYGITPNDCITTIHALRIALDGIERSDAMLHGRQPCHQITASMAKAIALKLGAELNNEEAEIFADGYNAAVLHGGKFRGNTNSSTNNFREISETSTSSPVTPDGWISCSERMPPQDDWILIYSKHGEYMAGQVQGEYVELSDGTLSWLGNALFWMPLPEPPQEAK